MDARSAPYFWDVNARTLEPNKDVAVKTLTEWSENDVEAFRRIHRELGFFIPRGGGIIWFS